jgi:hypothetical protein
LHGNNRKDEPRIAESDTAPYVIKEAYNNNIPITKVPCLEEAVLTEVVKFMVVGEPAQIAAAIPALKERTNGEINIFLSEPYFMEVTAPGIEKASALAYLTEHLNIGREQLCAVGDGLNDLTMLQYAGYAVAMGNAYDEVKKTADYITDTNDSDGAAKFIENLLEKGCRIK